MTQSRLKLTVPKSVNMLRIQRRVVNEKQFLYSQVLIFLSKHENVSGCFVWMLIVVKMYTHTHTRARWKRNSVDMCTCIQYQVPLKSCFQVMQLIGFIFFFAMETNNSLKVNNSNNKKFLAYINSIHLGSSRWLILIICMNYFYTFTLKSHENFPTATEYGKSLQ